MTRVHAFVEVHHRFRAGQHERDGLFGHGSGVRTRRRKHLDATPLGGGTVDRVGATAVFGDDAQRR